MAHELTLSFVPEVTQRLWRTVTRRKYQLTRNRVQLHNRLESLLEEAHIKVSSSVSDLLGASARRMLRAVASGETDPAISASIPQFDGPFPMAIFATAISNAIEFANPQCSFQRALQSAWHAEAAP